MNRQVLLPDGSIGWIVDQPPSSSPQVPHNHPPSVAPVQSTNNQSPSQFIYVSQQSRYLSPQAQFEQQHTRYMEVPSNSMYPPTHQFPSYQQPNSNMMSFNQSSYTQPNSQMIPMNLSSNAFAPNNPNQSTFHDPSVRLITNGPTNAPIIPSQPKIDTKSSPKSYLEQHHPEFESHPDYEPMRSKFRRELKHCQDNLGLDDGRKQYWRQFAYYCLDAIIHKKNPTDEEIKQVMESIIPLAGREEPFFIHLFQVVKFCLNYKSLGVKRESIKSPATEPVVKIESNKSPEVVYIDTTKNLEDNHKLLQTNDEKSQSKEGATSSPSESRNNKLVSFSDKSSANDRQPSSRDSIPRDPYRKPSPRDPKSRDHPPTRNERKIHAAERRYKEAQHWNRERNKQGTYGVIHQITQQTITTVTTIITMVIISITGTILAMIQTSRNDGNLENQTVIVMITIPKRIDRIMVAKDENRTEANLLQMNVILKILKDGNRKDGKAKDGNRKDGIQKNDNLVGNQKNAILKKV